MTSATASRRSSNGLAVAVIATPPGVTRAAGSRDHRLGFHLGRPVRATCRFDGRTHNRLQSRGDIDLVPAGVPGVWEDDRATRILRVSVSSELLRQAADGLGVDVDRVELVPQYKLRDPRLEHIAWALEAELRWPEAGEWLYGESLGMALAAHLVRHYRSSALSIPEPRQGLSQRQLRHVTDYVEAHLDRTLTLADLANVAGASVSHFKTLFKRSTKLPVHQFVVQRRVERARWLLEQGTPIATAAHEAGFTDQSHMARWMRRVLGVSPRDVLKGDR